MNREELIMEENMSLFIEENIINSVKSLLLGRVNEVLGEAEFMIPPVEFGQSGITGLPGEFRQSRNSMHVSRWGYYATTPEVAVVGCERSEKERIVLMDAYKVTISFTVSGEYGERNCYAYAAAVDRAVRENPTLGGTVDYALLVQKQYTAPKHPEMGEDWEVVLTIRITTEGLL
jgi:hypothetical protein